MNVLLILGIDTSGKTASTALYEDGIIIAQNNLYTNRTHSQVILPICKRMMEDANKPLSDVDVFAVSLGPGSYTGLRIGISAVKAMAFALKKDCVGISTLEALAYNMLGYKGVICSIIKARLDLVYTAVFEGDGNTITRLSDDKIITQDEVLANISQYDKDVILVGDGADEFYEKYKHDFLYIAPPHLKHQLASSLCLASLKHNAVFPDDLEASYLQPTKAEKDLNK